MPPQLPTPTLFVSCLFQGAGEEIQEESPPRQGGGGGGETSGSTNEGEKPWSVREDFRRRMKELKQKYRDAPDCYKGYEALLDTYEDPTMPIPTGMKAVRKLCNTTPVQYSDCKQRVGPSTVYIVYVKAIPLGIM